MTVSGEMTLFVTVEKWTLTSLMRLAERGVGDSLCKNCKGLPDTLETAFVAVL